MNGLQPRLIHDGVDAWRVPRLENKGVSVGVFVASSKFCFRTIIIIGSPTGWEKHFLANTWFR